MNHSFSVEVEVECGKQFKCGKDVVSVYNPLGNE
jgi:hypothetical protein